MLMDLLDISNVPITNQFAKEGLVVGMVGKQRKYSMEQADIPNIRSWVTFLVLNPSYFLINGLHLSKQENNVSKNELTFDDKSSEITFFVIA